MDKFQIYFSQHSSWQQGFTLFYPFLFKESIYALTYNHRLKRSSLLETRRYDDKFHFLIVKWLISKMEQQNPLLIYTIASNPNHNLFFDHYKNAHFKIILVEFLIVGELPVFLCLVSSIEEKKRLAFYSLRSIHSLFPFLEDRFSHLNYVLNILIPYPIHLEILIQIIHYRVKDVFSLHFLRFFLYQIYNWNNVIYPFFFFKKKNKRLLLFLYNFCVCEYESIFLFICNQSSYLQLPLFGILLERIYFYEKIECLVDGFSEHFRVVSWLFIGRFRHSVRYQGKWILASKSKGAPFLMNKWKYYLVNFWQCRFFLWSQPEKIQINQLFKHFFDFLGYRSSVQLNLLLIRSQTLEISFVMDNFIQKFYTVAPIFYLVGALTKTKFCNVLGHPISKSVWVNLSDSDIIDQFWRRWRDLYHYHSGFLKKKKFYRIKYILRLSCARTLAQKHKNVGHTFFKILKMEFFIADEQVFSLIFLRFYSISRGFYKGRIWYLYISCIYKLVN
nr:maturase K [Quinchamalium chilense]